VAAKIEHHQGELFPRAGFLVTSPRRPRANCIGGIPGERAIKMTGGDPGEVIVTIGPHAIEDTRAKRLATYRLCEYCGQTNPPGWMHDGIATCINKSARRPGLKPDSAAGTGLPTVTALRRPCLPSCYGRYP